MSKFYITVSPFGKYIYNVPFTYLWMGGKDNKYVIMEIHHNEAKWLSTYEKAYEEGYKIYKILVGNDIQLQRGIFILEKKPDGAMIRNNVLYWYEERFKNENKINA